MIKKFYLSADVFSDSTGKKWTAVIRRHDTINSDGVEVWRKEGMKTEYAATTSMESAWVKETQKLFNKDN